MVAQGGDTVRAANIGGTPVRDGKPRPYPIPFCFFRNWR